jgi:DNA phosphorothioation-dependent restriction protein DptG
MERTVLEDALTEAEQSIAEGKDYVDVQRAIIKRLAKEGQDTTKAKRVLRSFQDTIAVFIEERDRVKRVLTCATKEPKRRINPSR